MTDTRNQKYRVPVALVVYLMGWSPAKLYDQAVTELYVMQLQALPELQFTTPLSLEEAKVLATQLDDMGQLPHFVEGVVVANRPYEGSDVESLRSKVLEEYADSVFSNKHNPDPPVRGPFGEATIQVKPGVTPVKQRPYQMHGEEGRPEGPCLRRE